MKHCLLGFFLGFVLLTSHSIAESQDKGFYKLGIGDIINISVLQPQDLSVTVSVAPDGSINFPYIGQLTVAGLTLETVQDQIQTALAKDYMKYPVVSVALQESRSQKFFVYGEVNKPGTYPIESRSSVLKAISIAGGLTKFGSSSRVKILRERKDKPGYDAIKVNINAIMDGSADEDLLIQSGDIIVVSEGAF